MSPDRLRQPLSELERELALHEETPEEYSKLHEHTRRILDTEEHDLSLLQELRERLEASLVLAEAQHPLLANGILRVIDTLNTIGI